MAQQQMTMQQALEMAARHHQAGRLPQAEAIYRQILSVQPNNPDALHLLGLIGLQVGRLDVALELLNRAIAIAPNAPDYHYNLGQVLTALGRASEAIAAYRKSLKLRPDHASSWNNLGTALHSIGQSEDAIAALRKSIELRPDYAPAHYNLANVLHATGRIDEALEVYRRTVTLQPDLPEAWNNMGNVLRERGQVEDAVAAYRKTCQLKPDHPEALSNLGCLLQEAGHFDEAIDLLRKTLLLQPNIVAAHYNLGNVLRSMGRLDEALESFEKALEVKPDFADAHNAIGYTLREKGLTLASADAYRQALKIDPQNARAHHNLAMSLLVQGNYEHGLPEYEWRFKAHDPNALAMRLKKPTWDGSDLNGRTILLHAEQGFGDAIQFSRFASEVARRQGRGGRIILQCHSELKRLFATLKGPGEVVERRQDDGDLPEFDVHCPLLSLPFVLKTTVESIPAEIPYLHPDEEMSSRWRQRLSGDALKVGIVWAGRPEHKGDRQRSMSAENLASLGQVPRVQLISLQKHSSSAPPSFLDLTDWTRELVDFADTAALVDNLDLVITVDTAVAHLAGALGKPVWVLLPFVPDWRWLLDRTDSPWYPTMRLFRQPAMNDWQTPVGQVAEALNGLICGKGAGADG